MLNKSNRKVINVDSSNLVPIYTFKQEDDAVLLLSLFRNSVALDVTGQTITLGVKRADGTLVNLEALEGDNPFTINKNELDIKLKNSALAVPGLLECDLELVDVEGKMTTASFYITVNRKVVGDTNIKATNEIAILEKIKLEEEKREANENNRIKNEISRNNAEELRISNENTRIENENLRKTNEENRALKETERLDNEEVRKIRETKRVDKELERVTNEDLRKSNEVTRTNNEETRKNKETERVNNEANRANSESARVLAENTRKSNETTRQDKEQERITAEEIRKANELKRETVYKEIQDSRKDFNGKIRDNLSERLNSDMSYVADRFNNASLLEYEDKYISASESFDGVTKDLQIRGRTIKNLLGSRGNLEKANDFNGLIQSTTVKKFGNYSGKLTGNNNNPSLYLDLEWLDSTHKYLYSAYGYIESLASGTFVLAVCDYGVWGGATKSVQFDSTKLNQWQRKSIILDSISSKRLYSALSNATGVAYIDGVMIYDLTEIYGAGKEPTDIAQLERELPYVDGITSANPSAIKSVGKNLFDGNMYFGTVAIETGLILANSLRMSTSLTKIKPNTNYKLSGYNGYSIPWICFYDKTKNYLGKILNVGYISGTSAFVSPNNAYYCIQSFNNVNATTITQSDLDYLKNNLQIVEGTEIPPYEPYKESQAILPSVTDGLKSLPNGTKDTIDLENGKLIQRVRKVILNGSENWSKVQTDTLTTYFSISNWSSTNNCKPNTSIMSNNFKQGTSTVIDEEFVSIGNNFNLRINNTKLTTQDVIGLKTWLQANPTTVYYELATPIETPLDLPNNLRTFDKKTHIFTEGNELEPSIYAKIPSNVNSIVKTLQAVNAKLNMVIEKNNLNTIALSLDQEARLTKLELGVI